MVTDALGGRQTALLLGGTSEIGLAIVTELLGRGVSTVVLAGRRPDALANAAMPLRASGATVTTVAFDADLFDSHSQIIDEVVERHGDIDVAIVAFGALGDQHVAETAASAALAIARTNYLGAVSVLTQLGNRVRAQGHGTIIVLSSVAGERVRRSNYVYGSSKAGLDGFALGLGEALRGSGASVLVVRPGFVHSRMTAGLPAAPLSTTPAAVAQATMRGLDRRASLIWAPSNLRLVMSVLRHLPRPVLRRLPI